LEYYALWEKSNGDFTCYPCSKSQTNYFNQYTDCANCIFDDDGDEVGDGCNGCTDHYIDSTGACHPTCGVNGYGVATYGDYGVVDTSVCYTCDASCHECNGAGSGRCTSCNEGYYLDRTANGSTYFQYGTCVAKADYNPCASIWLWCPTTYTYSLYVSPPGSNSASAETITGDTGNRFNYLQDAIDKAYELGAPYNDALITIYLGSSSTTKHAMTRGDAEHYTAANTDWRSQNTKIDIKTESGTQETVLYKLRDKYVFKVGKQLRLYDIIFDAIDSVCDSCTNALSTTNTCSNSGTSLAATCSYQREPTEFCPGGATGTFIEFDATSDTMLDDYQVLYIENCEFKNFLYEMNSFIELNPFGAHIDIIDSTFSQFSFCGSFISNRDYYIYENTDLDQTDWEENWQYRATNYQAELFEDYKYAGWSGMSWSGCSTSTSVTTDLCFDLYVSGSTFSEFGKHKSQIDGPLWVDPDLNQQFYGSVFDLKGFRGDVAFVNNIFEENISNYQDCNTAEDIMNSDNNYSGTDDPYPTYGDDKDYIQIKSVISVTDHFHGFYMTGNTFERNTGTKGVVYLDLHDRKNHALVISGNTFESNGGYVDASVLHIRVRAPSGKTLGTTVPDSPADFFCHNIDISSNTFTYNYGCGQAVGGVIRFQCINYGATSTGDYD